MGETVKFKVPDWKTIQTKVNPKLFEGLRNSIEALEAPEEHTQEILDCVRQVLDMLSNGTMPTKYVHDHADFESLSPSVVSLIRSDAGRVGVSLSMLARVIWVEYPFSPLCVPEQPIYKFIMPGCTVYPKTSGNGHVEVARFDPLVMRVVHAHHP